MAIRMSLVELKAIFAGLVFVCGGVSVLLRSNFIFLLLACCMQEEKKTHSALPASERENRRQAAPQRLRIEYGYLTTLPDDYTGLRHVVTVQQLQRTRQAATTRSSSTSATWTRR